MKAVLRTVVLMAGFPTLQSYNAFVFCKNFLEKNAELFGEFCISKLEKIAEVPVGHFYRPNTSAGIVNCYKV